MTLFILSFLYKDNPFYRLAEHIFVGISLGYMLVFYIWSVLVPDWIEPLGDGRMSLLIPGVLGVLAVSRVVPKLTWLSRPTFAFIMGYGAGMAIPAAVEAFVLRHSESTVTPIGNWTSSMNMFTAFSDILVVVILLCCLIYFFFSIEHKGAVGVAAKAGIFFLMIQFGIAYGNTVMGRMALLYGRFFELKTYSSRDYGYATPILLVATVIGIVIFEMMSRRKAGPGGDLPAAELVPETGPAPDAGSAAEEVTEPEKPAE
ncbi:MAG: hypothetical protein ACYTAF_08745 [Planctomycetota bacterium]